MSLSGEKIQATVAVLTRNSGKTLRRALEGVRDFEEILICDGGSSDDTLDIAREFGATIVMQDKKYHDESGSLFDYGGVHNQALDASKHNWHFFVDSDEYCESSIIDAIRKVVRERGADGEGAFWVNRKYVINGTVVDCAATYPNRQMRFFAKRSAEHFIKKVHERIKLKSGVNPEYLEGFMHIPFEPDLLAIRRKWGHQIAVAAEQAGSLSLWQFISAVFDCAKVSALWLFRLARNFIFCSGNKMPLKFEMERHYFHIRLLRALWKNVRFS